MTGPIKMPTAMLKAAMTLPAGIDEAPLAKLLGSYGNGGTLPLPPPTPRDLASVVQGLANAGAPSEVVDLLTRLFRRWGFERALMRAAAPELPRDVPSDDDPLAPAGWVVYMGDTLRAAGVPLAPGTGHWALTGDPRDPAALQAAGEARADAEVRLAERTEADLLHRLARRIEAHAADERDLLRQGAELMCWPRDEDGSLMPMMDVGVMGGLTRPAASRLERAGLVAWGADIVTLTERGRRAGTFYERLHREVLAEMEAGE